MTSLIALALVAQIAAATPAPAPAPAPARLSGGFGQKAVKPATGQRLRIVITDDTIAPAAGRGTFSVTGTTQSASAAPESGASPSADLETVWRERVGRLRGELAAAERDYAAADVANTVVTHGRAGMAHSMLMAIRNAALAPYRLRMMEARRALDALPEECRQTAGCQPGWIR